MNTPARRYFTYQEAAAVLPKVQEITAEAFRISEEIHSQLATVTDQLPEMLLTIFQPHRPLAQPR